MSGGNRNRTLVGQASELYPPEEVARVERAFLRLRRKHRQMLIMASVEKLTCTEMAERLGISIEQVERRMADMIHAFDRAMEKEERRGRRPWWRLR